jgi:hypothetical protein
MAIEYRIILDEEHEFSYRIQLDRAYDRSLAVAAPAWTRLEHQQCSNCPLSRNDYSHCPAAVDLHKVIEDFQGLPAFTRAMVWVRTPEREYHKLVSLEEGLRSLLGVIMATSACPALSRLKPMAQQHLPFASNQEFILRAVSLYLARQYFNFREGQLQLVNQAFWQRIHTTCKADSNLKAFLTFFSMASSMTVSLETQLQKIRPQVMSSGDGLE